MTCTRVYSIHRCYQQRGKKKNHQTDGCYFEGSRFRAQPEYPIQKNNERIKENDENDSFIVALPCAVDQPGDNAGVNDGRDD